MLAGGTVSTLVGSGTAGGAAGWDTGAQLNAPFHLTHVPSQGALYVTQAATHVVVRVLCAWPTPSPTPSPSLSPTPSPAPPPPPAPRCALATIAGNGVTPTLGYANTPASPTLFNSPWAIAPLGRGGGGGGGSSAPLFVVADKANNRLRAVHANGTVVLLAGNGTATDGDGVGATASFNGPTALAAPADGAAAGGGGGGGALLVLAAGGGGGLVRAVSPEGVVVTLGPGPPGAEGLAVAAAVRFPGINVSAVYIADTASHVLALLLPHNKSLVGAWCGVGGGAPSYAEGPCASAGFSTPRGLALGGWGGSAPPGSANKLYVADSGNHRLRVVNLLTSMVSTLVGSGLPKLLDGVGAVVAFFEPAGLAISPDGSRLLVTELGNHGVREVALGEVVRVTTLAYGGTSPGLANGAAIGAA